LHKHGPFAAGLLVRRRSWRCLVVVIRVPRRVVSALRRLDTLLLAAIVPLVIVVVVVALVLAGRRSVLGRRRSVYAGVVLLRVLGGWGHPASAVARVEAVLPAAAGVSASTMANS